MDEIATFAEKQCPVQLLYFRDLSWTYPSDGFGFPEVKAAKIVPKGDLLHINVTVWKTEHVGKC